MDTNTIIEISALQAEMKGMEAYNNRKSTDFYKEKAFKEIANRMRALKQPNPLLLACKRALALMEIACEANSRIDALYARDALAFAIEAYEKENSINRKHNNPPVDAPKRPKMPGETPQPIEIWFSYYAALETYATALETYIAKHHIG